MISAVEETDAEREENWWVVGTTWIESSGPASSCSVYQPDMALVCKITRFSINARQVSDTCLVEGLMLTE